MRPACDVLAYLDLDLGVLQLTVCKGIGSKVEKSEQRRFHTP